MEDVYMIMCVYVENVWFDVGDEVWMLCIQLGNKLMMWILVKKNIKIVRSTIVARNSAKLKNSVTCLVHVASAPLM